MSLCVGQGVEAALGVSICLNVEVLEVDLPVSLIDVLILRGHFVDVLLLWIQVAPVVLLQGALISSIDLRLSR